MQSLLVITHQQFTHINSYQQFLTHLLSTHQLLPAAVFWQFVNFPHSLLIDQVRHLQTQVLQSGGERTTIFVISDFQLTANVVQNSLLKLLEQPPASTLFLLTSSSATPVLNTIRSRCQLLFDPTLNLTHFHPTLTDLDFPHWHKLTASQLAQLLIDQLTLAHKEVKKTQSDLTFNSFVDQALTYYLQTLTTDLTADSTLAWQTQVIQALQHSLLYLRSHVSAKNVLYALALAIRS